jgi:hypothetical protein
VVAAAPALVWQSIGPTRIPNGQTYGTNRIDVIGRVSAIAIDPKDAKHILLGAAGGGIWESDDTGATWAARTDQMPSLAIGAIAFDPKNAKRVYAGSGEGNFYSTLGAGVYASSDGGTTWSVLASAQFVGVGFYDLIVDPGSPSTLYAATTAGFYKSTNSGSNWSLKKSGRCWAISVHPNGGATELLATFDSGLFSSTNAGNSFAAVQLPSGANTWARLAVDRVQSAPDVAYVFGASGGSAYLWRRSGTTWTKITGLPTIDISQAWYDWYVAAPPDNQNQVYLGAIEGWRGDLKGSKWKWVNIVTQGSNSIHPDQHCLTFSPGNSKIIYAGSDGGIFRSASSGASWKALNSGLAITEIEYLAGDPATWKWLIAGTQDNGTLVFAGSPTWDHAADGDGGDCGVNQFNTNIVYHSYYGMTLERSTNKGKTWTSILPPPNLTGSFYPPVEVFGLTVAMAGDSLAITRTGTPPWTTVSLALTANELPTAMRAISSNALVIGTNFGRMMQISWTGASWQRAMLTSPASRSMSCIAVDPSNPQRLWVTFSQINGGLVYRSDDGGAKWVDCTKGLPSIPMNSVVVDPELPARLGLSGCRRLSDIGLR